MLQPRVFDTRTTIMVYLHLKLSKRIVVQ